MRVVNTFSRRYVVQTGEFLNPARTVTDWEDAGYFRSLDEARFDAERLAGSHPKTRIVDLEENE